MLLEFKVANYKSFKDELFFSMIPASQQVDLEYSLLRETIGNNTYTGLSSAVIYGANASGKTNIISAMDTFKNIILRGNIRNSTEHNTPNVAAYNLELIPNNTAQEAKPVDFSITFIEQALLIEYTLSLDLGLFLDRNSKRKIIQETLSINNQVVFDRNSGLKIDIPNDIKSYFLDVFLENKESALALAESSLDDEELFLMNGCKAIVSTKITAVITEWLKKKCIVIYRANSIKSNSILTEHKKNSIYVDKTVNTAAQLFGVQANALAYIVDEDNHGEQLWSLFENNSTGKSAAVLADVFESYGTIRFLTIFPLVVKTLLTGGTLIVDEFDASIHPMALMNIITIFHNDEINKKKAQLIFNTHNPIFLNANLFRRDEIKFVERDDTTQCSSHYSLSDFETAEKTAVCKTEDYMKNYFISRYGAIKDIDFTSIFRELTDKEAKL